MRWKIAAGLLLAQHSIFIDGTPSHAEEVAYTWVNQPELRSYNAPAVYSVRAVDEATGSDAVAIRRIGIGRYAVDLGGIIGRGVHAQVGAFAGMGAHCQLLNLQDGGVAGLRPGEVEVGCFEPEGRPKDTQFSVLAVRGEVGDAHLAYARVGIIAGRRAKVIFEYSHLPAGNARANRIAAGVYEVTLPLPSTIIPTGANIQITTYGQTPARCTVESWVVGFARVACRDHDGAPIDTGFALLAHKPRPRGRGVDFAYAWSHKANVRSYRPDPRHSFVAASAEPAQRLGEGHYLIDSGLVPAGKRPNVQVSSFQAGVDCGPAFWGHGQIEVRCFDWNGNPRDSRFTLLALAPALQIRPGAIPKRTSALFEPTFRLESLNGRNGFVLNGIDAGDHSGWSVSAAGDVNDDGIDDLIIGAPDADPNERDGAGQSYVVFGNAAIGGDGLLELSDLTDPRGTKGFVLDGVNGGDAAGWSVSTAGDVNNDDKDDLIIGAPEPDPLSERAGASYVVFGDSGVGEGGRVALSDLDGTNGFALDGTVGGNRSGWSVSAAGDVNDDDIDDLIIGAPFYEPLFAGASYVVFGRSGVRDPHVWLWGLRSRGEGFGLFGHPGGDQGDRSGWSVSAAGDVNDDGKNDLIIGAPFGDGIGARSYVVFGGAELSRPSDRPFGEVALSDLRERGDGFGFGAIAEDDELGHSVSAAGDVNGDGIDDLIIGSPAFPPPERTGRSYVVFGGAGLGDGVDLERLDGDNGFAIHGINHGDEAGRSVSVAGDVNNDGIDDLIIGAPGSPESTDRTGSSYVVFGHSGVGGDGHLELSRLNGSNGFVLSGVDEGDHSGWSVSAAGDVNGDRIDDLIIGAPDADPNGREAAGASYVMFGRPTPKDACEFLADNDVITGATDLAASMCSSPWRKVRDDVLGNNELWELRVPALSFGSPDDLDWFTLGVWPWTLREQGPTDTCQPRLEVAFPSHLEFAATPDIAVDAAAVGVQPSFFDRSRIGVLGSPSESDRIFFRAGPAPDSREARYDLVLRFFAVTPEAGHDCSIVPPF